MKTISGKLFVCLSILTSSLSAPDFVPKKAIIIGASSGMGRELAKILATEGYIVGLAARRLELLQKLQQEIPTQSYIKQIDAYQPEKAVKDLENLITQMQGVDLLIISITGARDIDTTDRNWKSDKPLLDVDVVGFFALARTGLNFFEKQGNGHLVGFSSIDGLRGIASCPAYSAAKAFCSRYLEAERNRCIQNNIPITITDVMPGWVNSQELSTELLKSKNPKAYWIDSLSEATKEIFAAIKNKASIAYSSKRWQEVVDMIKIMPDALYNALGGI